MEKTFLYGTTILGDTDTGFDLGKRIAIPIKNIVQIEDGLPTSSCIDALENSKCNTTAFAEIITTKRFLGTYIDYFPYYSDKENINRILLREPWEECMHQIKQF